MLISCFAGLGCCTEVYMRIPIFSSYARSLWVGIVEMVIIDSLFMMISELIPPDSSGVALGGYNACIRGGI
jgi:hypothetical protein